LKNVVVIDAAGAADSTLTKIWAGASKVVLAQR
jgi:hypothetical protein